MSGIFLNLFIFLPSYSSSADQLSATATQFSRQMRELGATNNGSKQNVYKQTADAPYRSAVL